MKNVDEDFVLVHDPKILICHQMRKHTQCCTSVLIKTSSISIIMMMGRSQTHAKFEKCENIRKISSFFLRYLWGSFGQTMWKSPASWLVNLILGWIEMRWNLKGNERAIDHFRRLIMLWMSRQSKYRISFCLLPL